MPALSRSLVNSLMSVCSSAKAAYDRGSINIGTHFVTLIFWLFFMAVKMRQYFPFYVTDKY